MFYLMCFAYALILRTELAICVLKGSRMGHFVKVSLCCVALLINTRFCFF